MPLDSYYPAEGRWQILVGAVGIEPCSPLNPRKLLILRCSQTAENPRKAEVRYTAGTRRHPRPPFVSAAMPASWHALLLLQLCLP
jgi:hypothetical protein